MTRVLSLCLVLAALPAAVLADGQGGTQSPFAFGVGSRDLAMGGATTASCEVATAPFWNPARLTRAEQFTFSGFHSSLYESEMAYQYAGLVVPTLDFGAIGLGIARLGIGGIERRDDGNLLLGSFDDTRLGFFLGYGKRLGAYELGLTLSLESHSLDTYSATSSPGLTLAANRQFAPASAWLHGLALSAVVRNLIKPGLKLDAATVNYPLALEFGVGLDIPPGAPDDPRITLNARAEQVTDLDPAVSAGLEYDLYGLLKLRGGVRTGDMSFGVGLAYGAFSFDYALVDRDLGSLHMFTLTSAFGKSVSRRRLERDRAQEARFNALMHDRLLATNRETVGRLVEDGRQLLADQNYREAENRFDRALFLARSSDLDTTAVARLADSTRQLLADHERQGRIEKNLAAAETQLQQKSFLQARYFASQVLQDDAASDRAARIVAAADSVLRASEAEDRLLRDRLWAIDSLLSFGLVRQAGQVAASIEQYADLNAGVQVAIRRVEFERWREGRCRGLCRPGSGRGPHGPRLRLEPLPGSPVVPRHPHAHHAGA
jgi:hypothetical protein